MISPMDRVFVADLCLARAGLKVDAEKAYLIDSRLAPVVIFSIKIAARCFSKET